MNRKMNYLFGHNFWKTSLNAKEARLIAEGNKLSRDDKQFQQCMKDVRTSASSGFFYTNFHTQDPKVVESLQKKGYQVKLCQYSEWDYNYGFPETIEKHGIKISW